MQNSFDRSNKMMYPVAIFERIRGSVTSFVSEAPPNSALTLTAWIRLQFPPDIPSSPSPDLYACRADSSRANKENSGWVPEAPHHDSKPGTSGNQVCLKDRLSQTSVRSNHPSATLPRQSFTQNQVEGPKLIMRCPGRSGVSNSSPARCVNTGVSSTLSPVGTQMSPRTTVDFEKHRRHSFSNRSFYSINIEDVKVKLPLTIDADLKHCENATSVSKPVIQQTNPVPSDVSHWRIVNYDIRHTSVRPDVISSHQRIDSPRPARPLRLSTTSLSPNQQLLRKRSVDYCRDKRLDSSHVMSQPERNSTHSGPRATQASSLSEINFIPEASNDENLEMFSTLTAFHHSRNDAVKSQLEITSSPATRTSAMSAQPEMTVSRETRNNARSKLYSIHNSSNHSDHSIAKPQSEISSSHISRSSMTPSQTETNEAGIARRSNLYSTHSLSSHSVKNTAVSKPEIKSAQASRTRRAPCPREMNSSHSSRIVAHPEYFFTRSKQKMYLTHNVSNTSRVRYCKQSPSWEKDVGVEVEVWTDAPLVSSPSGGMTNVPMTFRSAKNGCMCFSTNLQILFSGSWHVFYRARLQDSQAEWTWADGILPDIILLAEERSKVRNRNKSRYQARTVLGHAPDLQDSSSGHIPHSSSCKIREIKANLFLDFFPELHSEKLQAPY